MKIKLNEHTCNAIMQKLRFTSPMQVQFLKAIEECSEFTTAIAKYTSKPDRGNADVISEIADVLIMMTQMAYYFGVDLVNDEIEKKLNRTIERFCIAPEVTE